MKYSMVAINGKVPEPGLIYVRRVLISYSGKKDAILHNVPICIYTGTRLLERDAYFKDPTKANQYEFTDASYVLTKTEYAHNRSVESEERTYHYYNFETSDEYQNRLKPIEFEADSDEAAIEKFNKRNELR